MKRLFSLFLVFIIIISSCALSESSYEDLQLNDWMDSFIDNHKQINDGQILTLVNCENIMDFRMANAIMAFEEETGIHVVTKEISRTQLLTQLLSKDNSIDLLFADSSYLQELQQAGVLYSLDTFKDLQIALHKWMNVLESGKVNGELYCLPAYLSAGIIYIQNELLPFMTKQIPDKYSWSELLALGDSFSPGNTGTGKPIACFMADNLLYPEFIRQYLSAKAEEKKTLSDDELKQTLLIYKDLYKKGLIKDEFNDHDTRGALLHVDRMIELNTNPFINMPNMGDGSAYTVGYVHGICVNAFSEKKKEAERFLTIYADEENQAYPEGYGFVENIDLNHDASHLTSAEREQLLRCKDYYETVRPLWQKDDFIDFLCDEMEHYLSDEISLDQLIEALNKKLLMVIYG